MTENKFIKAYDDLMSHLYEALDESLHSIADALEIAKEKSFALGGHTQEEINKVADFVMRDVEHAAVKSPDNEQNSLSEWLKFDLNLIENFAIKSFWDIADKTRVKLSALEMDAKQYHPYQTGDIASPGTFICDHCGKHLAFKSTSVLPVCPQCQTKSFSRC